ncbi:urease accessory protein [Aequitasia blattaphilus]|uniref:Urease accessory protein UreD n=1 Tax=Aequitasia blattaphilus TaxID=2949332 RepID=A0ABT1E8U7_9FIRM|nr:urease accessory protein UreD [Aequitasia blattaphilus]MCP1102259.1 urease accessory protein UreD [Aequitasia blattaphilus]MCR8614899.1 urease accessory protein UreD [Aequitasia blattaphilus]
MGKLRIEAHVHNGRTVITDCFFTAPFKIVKPYYDKNRAEVMIMQASAGILEGDKYEVEIVVKSGASLMVTGQSYTKLFKMDSGYATQNVKITVESGASLFYLPCPIIPFGGSSFVSENEIHLQKGSEFIMQDILACGRKGMGEEFKFRKYHSRVVVYENERLIFVDNTRLIPKEYEYHKMGYFEGCSHQGVAYFYGRKQIKSINKSESITAAITNLRKGQILRILSDSGDRIVNYIKTYVEEENDGT